jgi:hypothetical protein
MACPRLEELAVAEVYVAYGRSYTEEEFLELLHPQGPLSWLNNATFWSLNEDRDTDPYELQFNAQRVAYVKPDPLQVTIHRVIQISEYTRAQRAISAAAAAAAAAPAAAEVAHIVQHGVAQKGDECAMQGRRRGYHAANGAAHGAGGGGGGVLKGARGAQPEGGGWGRWRRRRRRQRRQRGRQWRRGRAALHHARGFASLAVARGIRVFKRARCARPRHALHRW